MTMESKKPATNTVSDPFFVFAAHDGVMYTQFTGLWNLIGLDIDDDILARLITLGWIMIIL